MTHQLMPPPKFKKNITVNYVFFRSMFPQCAFSKELIELFGSEDSKLTGSNFIGLIPSDEIGKRAALFGLEMNDANIERICTEILKN